MRIERASFAEFGDGFALLIVLGESDGESEVGPGIVGIELQGLVPDLNRFGKLVLLHEIVSIVSETVELRGLRIDGFDCAGRHIDEFGDVDGAIGGGGIVHQDGRSGVAVRVNVRKHQARVGRVGFGGKGKPAAVGRKSVPGIHERGVGFKRTSGAAFKGNDVKLTVGAHQQAVVALDKDDPAAVGRDLGEIVAHAVGRSAEERLGFAALAVIKRNLVQVVLDLRFVGIVGMGGPGCARRIGIASLGTTEDQVLSIG